MAVFSRIIGFHHLLKSLLMACFFFCACLKRAESTGGLRRRGLWSVVRGSAKRPGHLEEISLSLMLPAQHSSSSVWRLSRAEDGNDLICNSDDGMFSIKHLLSCHQALMVETITFAFPDTCFYPWWLGGDSLNGSVCVCMCVRVSSVWHHHTHSPDCYHKLLPVYSPLLGFFQGLGNSWVLDRLEVVSVLLRPSAAMLP